MKKILVNIAKQQLVLRSAGKVLFQCAVSTAANGTGQNIGSECTPLGEHIIRAMIGAGAPLNSVFVGRRATGEIYTPELRAAFPERDWILTRIMWLSGKQPGFNRLGTVDSMRRFIYIHGCPDDDEIGQPGSHGCIKLRNSDVVTLFDMVEPYMNVSITDT